MNAGCGGPRVRVGAPSGRVVAALAATALGAAVLAAVACGKGGGGAPAPSPAPKGLPAPIFDGLTLGMTRAEVAKAHAIRPTRTSSGSDRRIWTYERRGEHAVRLRFDGIGEGAALVRFDVHFGPRREGAEEFVGRFEAVLGVPEARRRKPAVESYGDPNHQQLDTIWSDTAQYVFLTERVPIAGRRGNPVYFLTVKRRELSAAGPATGYVPPPPPEGKDGAPAEEPPF